MFALQKTAFSFLAQWFVKAQDVFNLYYDDDDDYFYYYYYCFP